MVLSWNPGWFQRCRVCGHRFRYEGVAPPTSWWIWYRGRPITGPAGVPTCGWHLLVPAGWPPELASWNSLRYVEWRERGRELNRALRVLQRRPPTWYRPPAGW